MGKKYKFKVDRLFRQSIESLLVKMVNMKKDAGIVITGSTGSGKSVLGMQVGMLCCEQTDLEFSLSDNIIYYPKFDLIQNKVLNEPKMFPIIIDEAIKSVYSLDFVKSDSKKLKKFLDTCRKHGKILIFCLPQIRDFSSKMINRISIWVQIVYRDERYGIASVFGRDRNFFKKNKWDIDNLEERLEQSLKDNPNMVFDTVSKANKVFDGARNYLFSFKFYNIPDKMYEEYESIAIALAKELEKEENYQVDTDPYRVMIRRVIGLLYYKEKKTQTEIIEELNIGKGTFYDLLKEYQEKNNISIQEHKKIKSEIMSKARSKK